MMTRIRDYLQTPEGKVETGVNTLFVAGFPLLIWGAHDADAGLFTACFVLLILCAAIRLIVAGQEIHKAYSNARVARHPAVPRKLIGCVLIGVTVFLLAGLQFNNLVVPTGFGATGVALSLAAFGMDPMTDKAPKGRKADRSSGSDLINAIEERLETLVINVSGLGDAQLAELAEGGRASVLRLLLTFNDLPSEQKKHLKASTRFAELMQAEIDHLMAAGDDSEFDLARRRFVKRMTAMQQSFDARAKKFTEARATDTFDLQADRLLDRMPQEQAA